MCIFLSNHLKTALCPSPKLTRRSNHLNEEENNPHGIFAVIHLPCVRTSKATSPLSCALMVRSQFFAVLGFCYKTTFIQREEGNMTAQEKWQLSQPFNFRSIVFITISVSLTIWSSLSVTCWWHLIFKENKPNLLLWKYLKASQIVMLWTCTSMHETHWTISLILRNNIILSYIKRVLLQKYETNVSFK